MPTLSKNDLRKKFREICRKIPAAYKEEAGLAAAKLGIALPVFKESERIACYLATKDEFDSLPFIDAIWRAKKQCYLPVMAENKNDKKLIFAHYQYGDALHANQYGILEPAHVGKTLDPEALDLVVLPLIAFDCYGHRLGTGGGYYDKTFEHLHNETMKKTFMLGLAYAAQQIDALPGDDWDVLLNGVLTEHEFIPCSS